MIDDVAARLRLDAQQPRGLRDGELQPRHLVEFSADSIDEGSHVHGVRSLKAVPFAVRVHPVSKTQADLTIWQVAEITRNFGEKPRER